MRNLERDTVNQAMVAAMIKLARTLNFKVIAEQVEDAASVDVARRMGVDYLQGYAIGRPQPLLLAPEAAATPHSNGTSSSATMLMILISGLMAVPRCPCMDRPPCRR